KVEDGGEVVPSGGDAFLVTAPGDGLGLTKLGGVTDTRGEDEGDERRDAEEQGTDPCQRLFGSTREHSGDDGDEEPDCSGQVGGAPSRTRVRRVEPLVFQVLAELLPRPAPLGARGAEFLGGDESCPDAALLEGFPQRDFERRAEKGPIEQADLYLLLAGRLDGECPAIRQVDEGGLKVPVHDVPVDEGSGHRGRPRGWWHRGRSGRAMRDRPLPEAAQADGEDQGRDR